MRVVCYLRVSTPKQDNEKFKLEMEKFCKRKGFKDYKYFPEKISTKKLSWRKGTELRKIVCSMKEGDVLVAPDLDRLARNAIDLLLIIEECDKRGIDLYLLKTPIGGGTDNPTNISKSSDKFLYTVLSAAAELERNKISERTKEKLQSLKSEGVYLGRPEVHNLLRKDIESGLIDRRRRKEGIKYTDIASEYSKKEFDEKINQIESLEMNADEVLAEQGVGWEMVYSKLSSDIKRLQEQTKSGAVVIDYSLVCRYLQEWRKKRQKEALELLEGMSV